jgi:multiple sugar transport system ATP-binding protein
MRRLPDPHLKISQIVRRVGETVILDRVDLDVAKGEFMVLIGPSGSGKSSLMRVIAGLDQPDSGTLTIGGRDAGRLAPAERGVAMVFQNYALYPHMTVAENMAFNLRLSGKTRAEIEAAVSRTAQILRLDALLHRKPAALSGGQRQRVAIGRALTRQPSVLLLDEPLSNLDASLREEMRLEFVRLHRKLGTTIVYVTHDQTEAMTMGDRIAVFNEGRIEQVGAPLEIYDAPATAFVASVLGAPRINLFPGEIAGRELRAEGWPALQLKDGLQRGESCVRFGVRPEDWLLLDEGGWPVQVDMVEHLGAETIVQALALEARRRITIRLPRERIQNVRAGDALRIAPGPGALHCFDHQGVRVGAL